MSLSDIITRIRLIRSIASLRTMAGNRPITIRWYLATWKKLDDLIAKGEISKGKNDAN